MSNKFIIIQEKWDGEVMHCLYRYTDDGDFELVFPYSSKEELYKTIDAIDAVDVEPYTLFAVTKKEDRHGNKYFDIKSLFG